MSKEKRGSLFYAKVFGFVFALVFLLAVVLRLYNSFSNSHFTGNSFNILLLADNYVGVVGMDKNDNKLYSVIVTKDLDVVRRRNILIQSVNFGIPIHAYIEFPKGFKAKPPTSEFFSLGNIQSVFANMSIKKENISLFDWFNIYKTTKGISRDEANIKTYATINDLSELLPEEEETFFRNSDIANRKTSLQIINATNINGLGNRVGDMLSRFGFNVVSVTTSNAENSYIYYSDDGDYGDALLISQTFEFPVEKTDEYVIADVTLVIGEDTELLLEDIAL